MKKLILILLSFNLASCGAIYTQPDKGKSSSIIRVDDQLTTEAIDKQFSLYRENNDEKTKGFFSTSEAQLTGLKVEMSIKSVTSDLTGIAKVDGVNDKLISATVILTSSPENNMKKLMEANDVKNAITKEAAIYVLKKHGDMVQRLIDERNNSNIESR